MRRRSWLNPIRALAPEMPALAPEMLKLAPVMPALAPVMPALAPVMPKLAPVMPAVAPDMPNLAQQGRFLAPALPDLAFGIPNLAPAMPRARKLGQPATFGITGATAGISGATAGITGATLFMGVGRAQSAFPGSQGLPQPGAPTARRLGNCRVTCPDGPARTRALPGAHFKHDLYYFQFLPFPHTLRLCAFA